MKLTETYSCRDAYLYSTISILRLIIVLFLFRDEVPLWTFFPSLTQSVEGCNITLFLFCPIPNNKVALQIKLYKTKKKLLL